MTSETSSTDSVQDTFVPEVTILELLGNSKFSKFLASCLGTNKIRLTKNVFNAYFEAGFTIYPISLYSPSLDGILLRRFGKEAASTFSMKCIIIFEDAPKPIAKSTAQEKAVEIFLQVFSEFASKQEKEND